MQGTGSRAHLTRSLDVGDAISNITRENNKARRRFMNLPDHISDVLQETGIDKETSEIAAAALLEEFDVIKDF